MVFVGIHAFLLTRGIVRAITKDLITKYLAMRHRFGDEEEQVTLERVWNFWLTLNEEKINNDKDYDMKVRLEIIKERYEKDDPNWTELYRVDLLSIFSDVLYIETEILSTSDEKTFNIVAKDFCDECKKHKVALKSDVFLR